MAKWLHEVDVRPLAPASLLFSSCDVRPGSFSAPSWTDPDIFILHINNLQYLKMTDFFFFILYFVTSIKTYKLFLSLYVGHLTTTNDFTTVKNSHKSILLLIY